MKTLVTKTIRNPRTTQTHRARMRHCADVINASRNAIAQISKMEPNMPRVAYDHIAAAVEQLESAIRAVKEEAGNLL